MDKRDNIIAKCKEDKKGRKKKGNRILGHAALPSLAWMKKIINIEEEKRTKLLTDKEKAMCHPNYGGFFECLVLLIQTATQISIIQIKFIKVRIDQ